MSSSNNGINTANNGRGSGSNNSANSMSISHKSDIKAREKNKTTTNNNDSKHNAANTTTHATATITTINAATHRRDSSSISGQQQKTQQTLQHKKEARIHFYGRPQQTQPTPIKEPETDIAAANNEHWLVYCEGNHLVSGSLAALIQHMVPTSDYYPEHTFIFSFLLSARLFIRPHEVLAKISQTWDEQQMHQKHETAGGDVVDDAHFNHATASSMAAAISSASPLTQRKTALNEHETNSLAAIPDIQKLQRSSTQRSAQNCIRLLSEWIETFPYDFRDERLMQQVRILARKCVYIDNALGRQVSRLLQLLVQRLTALEKYEEFLQTLNATELSYSQTLHQQQLSTAAAAASHSASSHTAANVALLAQGKCANNTTACGTNSHATLAQSDSHNSDIFGIMDLCPSCAQLAHQLTAIELERLSHIGPEEFVQAFAKEYSNSMVGKETAAAATANTSSLNDLKKTRNLESYVDWFNRLSYLTASEIVKYPKKKQRVRIIEFWIETARECFNIGNFNSLMAIIAGLNLAPISRLKKTWSKVQSAKFSVLEHQMDPTSNFNSYRSTLKAAMWRSEGATEERERIIIPFFSLFVKDLYFLNEGCSNRLPNNHINFEKCSQLAKQVMEFNEWKKVTCPFEQLPNVISFLQNCPLLNENTLAMASFECETPDNTDEKERYKTVKAETKQQLLQQLQEQQQQH